MNPDRTKQYPKPVMSGEAPLVKKITAIGSQGAAALAPENTLAAIRAGLSAGADGVELDFHICASGELVAYHDYRLNPDLTRDISGHWLKESGPAIKSMSLTRLKTYDVGRAKPGSPVAHKYPEQLAVDGERIPTLADVSQVLSEAQFSDRELWLEIKSNPVGREDIVSTPQVYTEALCVQLADHAIRKRTVVLAFDWRVLQMLSGHWPDLQTSYLSIDPVWIAGYPESTTGTPASSSSSLDRTVAMRAGFTGDRYASIPQAVAAAGGTYWSPYIADLTYSACIEARNLGLRISVWGADSQDQINDAIALGVDSITNSRPDRLKASILESC